MEGTNRQKADRKDAFIAACAVAGFIAAVVVGVWLPQSRPPSVAPDVTLDAAQNAVMLAEIHRDHPLQQMTRLTHDVRRFDPEADQVPLACSEANARESLVVTARTIWFLPTTQTLVGPCGMDSM